MEQQKMNPFLTIAWLLLGGLSILIQLRFAGANYPKGHSWLLLRFGSAFLCGAVLGILLFSDEYRGTQLFIAVLLTGIAFGILFAFVVLQNIKRLIPKKESPIDKED